MLVVVAASVVICVVLLPARADLHPTRSADELRARYGGRYSDEVLDRPKYAASSTSRVSVFDPSSAQSVFITTSTYPSPARAALAYRYWSPLRASWVKPWYEPASKPYPSDVVEVADGTQVRGVHCSADGYPLCGSWVFWQIEGSTLRETMIAGRPCSYEQALAQFAWIGRY